MTEHDVAGLLAGGRGSPCARRFPGGGDPPLGARRCATSTANGACRVLWSLLSRLGSHLVEEVSQADLVISTHPFASQILGKARARGQLGSPVVTYLTDASVHRFWVQLGCRSPSRHP